MKKSLLISILSSLSRKEMTYFKEFVNSPYFCKHADVRALTDYLSDLYPNFTEKTCHPDTILKALFGNKKIDNKKLPLVFTYTMRQLENFMAHEIFKEEEGKHKIFINRYLCNKEQYRLGSKQINQLKDLNLKDERRDLGSLQKKLEESRALDFLFSTQNKILNEEQLVEMHLYLDSSYLAEKIKLACENLARNISLKIDKKPDLKHFGLNEILKNPEKYVDTPAIYVYACIFNTLFTGEKEVYLHTKETVSNFSHLFSIEEERELYTYLTNYCTAKINKGDQEFWSEIFSIYKLLLQRETIFFKGYLREFYYKNIITVGTRLNEREWVEQFMEDYKEKLHPDRAENAYSFNKASYYYNIGELEKVQGLLLRVEYTAPRYVLGAKVLLLQTYFDLNEDEALFSLTDSFRLFLKRNKQLSASNRLAYANLFKLTKRLARIRGKKGFVSKHALEKDIDKLKRDFEKTESLAQKNWVRIKIEQVC